MKISNLILLNLCFLSFFPLLFGMYPGKGTGSQPRGMNYEGGSGSHSGGMHPGAGPSGSGPQQPMNLDDKIRQLLQVHGNTKPHPEKIPRRLENQGNMQLIDTIEKQYQNFNLKYNELQAESEYVSQEIKNRHKAAFDNLTTTTTLEKISAEIDQLVTRLQEIQNEKLKIMEDKQKIYNHLEEVEREWQHLIAESKRKEAERQSRYYQSRRDRKTGNRDSGSNN